MIGIIFILFYTSSMYGFLGSELTYSRACIDCQNGDWKTAQNKMSTLLVNQPDNAELLYDNGVVAYRLHEFEKAGAYFNQVAHDARASRALKKVAHFNLGNSYVGLGNYKQAVAEYEATLAIDPADEMAKHNLEKVKQLLEESEKNSAPEKNKDQKQPQKGEHEKEQEGEGEQQEDDSSSESGAQEKQEQGSGDKKNNDGKQGEEQSESSESEGSGGEQKEQKSDQQEKGEQEQQSDSESAGEDDQEEQDESGRDHGSSSQEEQESDDESSGHNTASQHTKDEEKEQDQSAQSSGQAEDEEDEADLDQDRRDEEQKQLKQKLAPNEQWMAHVLQRREKADEHANKQLIKETVNKNMTGRHGQNNW